MSNDMPKDVPEDVDTNMDTELFSHSEHDTVTNILPSQKGANTIRLLIVDDHLVVRKGTREILEDEADMEVVGEAANGEEAIEQVGLLSPDVILMDISMPKMNGIEATKCIKARYPKTSVLILTSYDEDSYIFALIDAGAAGYLLKNAEEEELINAVRAVAAGESVLHPSVTRKVLRHLDANRVDRKPSAPSHDQDDQDSHIHIEELSAREQEVLAVAARGLKNKEIARELDISPRTVQVHLANIFSKLGVGSRTEATAYAIRCGWIDVDSL